MPQPDYKITIGIPEDTANVFAQHVINSSHVDDFRTPSTPTPFTYGGFTVDMSLGAQCRATTPSTLVYINDAPPSTDHKVRLQGLDLSGKVTLNRISFNLNDFVASIVAHIIPGLPSNAMPHLAQPNITLTTTAFAGVPNTFALANVTIDSKVRVPVTQGHSAAQPGQVSVVADVILPPQHVDMEPMGPVLKHDIEAAVRAALQSGVDVPAIPLPPPLTGNVPGTGQHYPIPGAAVNQIVQTILTAWDAFWLAFKPALNESINQALRQLQIFNQTLALTLFTCPAHVVFALGQAHAVIDVPVQGTAGKTHLILQDGVFGEPGGDIKQVDIAIQRPLLTVTLHVTPI